MLSKEEKKVEIIKLIQEGIHYNIISKKYKCAISTISAYCKEAGIQNKNHRKPVDESLIEEIKKLYLEHKSTIKVAKIVGLSKNTIRKYVEIIKYEKLTDDEKKKYFVKKVINWRIKVKLKLLEYKGNKCEICNYDKCKAALEFHHKDPKEKDFNIGGKTYSFEVLKKEVDKCLLVCSNCHREIHDNLRISTNDI